MATNRPRRHQIAVSGISSPGWRGGFGAAHASFGLRRFPLEHRGRPGFRVESRTGFLGPGEPNRRDRRHPLSRRCIRTGKPIRFHRRQNPFHRGPTKDQAYQGSGCLPPTGTPRTRTHPKVSARPRDRLRSPGFCRPEPELAMFSRWCARPDRARLFTGEDVPHAARRLLQQIRPTNTPTELPDLDLSGADESAPIERPPFSLRTRPCEQGPLRGGPTEFAQLRGCGVRNTRRKRPLAPTDLPQPDGPGHLLSLTCTP